MVDISRRIPTLDKALRYAWADHGDSASQHYAGTGALKSGFTRTGKRTLDGYADDGWKSCVRYYKNNFADGVRQDMIDLGTGRFAGDSLNKSGLNYGDGRSPLLLVGVGLWLILYGFVNGTISTLTLVSVVVRGVLRLILGGGHGVEEGTCVVGGDELIEVNKGEEVVGEEGGVEEGSEGRVEVGSGEGDMGGEQQQQ